MTVSQSQSIYLDLDGMFQQCLNRRFGGEQHVCYAIKSEMFFLQQFNPFVHMF